MPILMYLNNYLIILVACTVQKKSFIDIHQLATKMMMPCLHSFNIAVVTSDHISYSCLLLFYRDAYVPYSSTVDVIVIAPFVLDT